jgi:hypothetical protein
MIKFKPKNKLKWKRFDNIRISIKNDVEYRIIKHIVVGHLKYYYTNINKPYYIELGNFTRLRDAKKALQKHYDNHIKQTNGRTSKKAEHIYLKEYINEKRNEAKSRK